MHCRPCIPGGGNIIQIVIANSEEKPLYIQIIEQLRKAILQGDLTAGENLPSIRALAADLSISVITTKRAYDVLAAEGLIEMIPGKGCFIAGNNNQLLRERRLHLLENLLEEALKQSRYLGISLEDLKAMLSLFHEEDRNECGSERNPSHKNV